MANASPLPASPPPDPTLGVGGQRHEAAPVQLGGQALVEGVMMRSPRFVGAAVRRANGEIQTRVERFEPIAKRHPVLALPIIRGMVGLIEMMLLGTRYLNWSSNLALEDSPEEAKKQNAKKSKAPQKSPVQSSAPAAEAEDSGEAATEQALPLWMFLGTVLLSLSLGFALFVALPNIVADATLGRATRNRFVLNIAEGCIKITIFVAYLWFIGRMANIKRLFEFHGAEHKVVYAAEHGRPLTPDGARPFDTPHPRCGTGFALLTAVVSIGCFSWLPWTLSHWPRVGMRFVLMPLVAGISYEILKLTAHPKWRPLAIVVMTPGMWLQRLTTNPPDDSQLEVSCAAMQLVIDAEAQAGTPVRPTQVKDGEGEETELETV